MMAIMMTTVRASGCLSVLQPASFLPSPSASAFVCVGRALVAGHRASSRAISTCVSRQNPVIISSFRPSADHVSTPQYRLRRWQASWARLGEGKSMIVAESHAKCAADSSSHTTTTTAANPSATYSSSSASPSSPAASAASAVSNNAEKNSQFPLLSVNDAVTLTKTFDEAHVETFSAVTGDYNPLHLDKSFAAASRFRQRIVHGIFVASMFGSIVGSSVPGAVYVSQQLEFCAPVFIGDTVTAKVQITRIDRRLYVCATTATNANGKVVVKGEAHYLFPNVRALSSLQTDI